MWEICEKVFRRFKKYMLLRFRAVKRHTKAYRVLQGILFETRRIEAIHRVGCMLDDQAFQNIECCIET